MTLDERMLNRIARLIEKGQSVLQTHKDNRPGVIGSLTLDHGLFSEWRSQCLTATARHRWSKSHHSVGFDKETRRSGYDFNAKAGIGILRSLREDIEHGGLAGLKTLVITEIFFGLAPHGQRTHRARLRPSSRITGRRCTGRWASAHSNLA